MLQDEPKMDGWAAVVMILAIAWPLLSILICLAVEAIRGR